MNDDHDQVIGIRFKNEWTDKILFGLDAIDQFRSLGSLKFQLVDRLVMKFMSRLDLGEKWGVASEYPTLFLRSEIPKQDC